MRRRGSKAASADAAQIDVASVRRGEGNRAFVIYKTPQTLSADMPMYLDGEVWTVGAIEAYVALHRSFHPDAEPVIDLVFGEFLARRERGESPTLDEYCQRFPVLAGKTWNVPAISGGYLLVRNLAEMAAFDLRVAK